MHTSLSTISLFSRPLPSSFLLGLFVATTNCGGSTDTAGNGDEASRGGVTDTHGTAGATTKGGTSGTVGGSKAIIAAEGGKSQGDTSTSAGTTSTGGTVSAVGGSTSTSTDRCAGPNAPKIDMNGCRDDEQCGSGRYCDLENCTGPCGCEGGKYICVNTCVAQCKPNICTQPSPAFASQISGKSCDVVVRVDSTATNVLSYRIVCGDYSSLSESEALSQLLPSSRINWSQATAYSAKNNKAHLFVHDSPYDIIEFGAVTGQTVFEVSKDGTRETVYGDWAPASDLNGSCKGVTPLQFEKLGPWEVTDSDSKIMQLLYKKGIFAAITGANGGMNGTVVTRAALSSVEYFVVISTVPRA